MPVTKAEILRNQTDDEARLLPQIFDRIDRALRQRYVGSGRVYLDYHALLPSAWGIQMTPRLVARIRDAYPDWTIEEFHDQRDGDALVFS